MARPSISSLDKLHGNLAWVTFIPGLRDQTALWIGDRNDPRTVPDVMKIVIPMPSPGICTSTQYPATEHSVSLLLCASQQFAEIGTEYTARGNNSEVTEKTETHFYLKLKSKPQ